tara:strand:+ start:35 stop:193 length:159 start_codon:yes stop_codon:yes gene_type:complete
MCGVLDVSVNLIDTTKVIALIASLAKDFIKKNGIGNLGQAKSRYYLQKDALF